MSSGQRPSRTGRGLSCRRRLAPDGQEDPDHAERDVTAVYDRYSYDPEKRTALEAWGRRLEAIVSETIVSETEDRARVVALTATRRGAKPRASAAGVR